MRMIAYFKKLLRLFVPSPLIDTLRWLARREIRTFFSLVDYFVICRLQRLQGRKTDASVSFKVVIRGLDNLELNLRPGTSDAAVALETLVGLYHLPPKTAGSPTVIWDLGANLGLTAAHFANLYSNARIYSVEANPTMAKIAKENLKKWDNRVKLMQAAVWHEETELRFSASFGDEYGGQIVDDENAIIVQGINLDSLSPMESIIDYVKMDIEGAERQVLKFNTGWAKRVRCIKVECHGNYSREECQVDLEKLGFETNIDDKHWNCVVGLRQD